MDNAIVIIVLVLILGLAIGYIVRAKKRGAKCIGCPSDSKCSGSCNCCSADKTECDNQNFD